MTAKISTVMGSIGVPREPTCLTVPKPNPKIYCSAEQPGHWDYTRISVVHLERVAA